MDIITSYRYQIKKCVLSSTQNTVVKIPTTDHQDFPARQLTHVNVEEAKAADSRNHAISVT